MSSAAGCGGGSAALSGRCAATAGAPHVAAEAINCVGGGASADNKASDRTASAGWPEKALMSPRAEAAG
jgi:hypothetical protein